MNYYGTDKYYKKIKNLDKQIFSKIMFDEPDRVKDLDGGYYVKYYYYADEENCLPGHAPVDGEVCRLFKNEEMVFEWKTTDGHSRLAVIVNHADGQQYFIFDEDLYGYSVLKLSDLTSVHYIPAESYGKYPEEFEETFLWCNCFYNSENNMLAVDGCFWASPNNVIVLDFTDPMHIVESKEWMDIYTRCREEYPDIDDIEFVRWNGSKLICKGDGAKPAGFILNDKVEVQFL
ncbi:MAG: hypothetical protein IJ054_06790 [Lachnospiraceae bacterium]|nr:hypothetical protein [Lachnospiraceae bacterium]